MILKSIVILLSETLSENDPLLGRTCTFDKLTATVTTATAGLRVFGVQRWFVIFSRVVMDRRYRVLFRFSRSIVPTGGFRVVRFLWRPFMFTAGRGRVVRFLWRPFMVATGGSRVVRFLWRSFICRVPTAAMHRRLWCCRVHWRYRVRSYGISSKKLSFGILMSEKDLFTAASWQKIRQVWAFTTQTYHYRHHCHYRWIPGFRGAWVVLHLH
jgi:hypothetical protein